MNRWLMDGGLHVLHLDCHPKAHVFTWSSVWQYWEITGPVSRWGLVEGSWVIGSVP